MVKVYTATMRYNGPDKLDITVKGSSTFGPTWDMVMGTKQGTMTEEEYVKKYYELMRGLYRSDKRAFQLICEVEVITFCCYCKPGAFCHRYILANMFSKLGAEYMGERA